MALLTLYLFACTDKGTDTAPSGGTDDTDPPVEETVDTAPVDADGDGYTADEDCDDNDDKVFPGAHEVWYDGEDWDCAGDDDYDADADGHQHDSYGGDDCDDHDATVFPGADDVYCDETDQDCDGTDASDLDGDGELAAECGGTDCDDSHPWIGAEQEEWCDELDHDCDGENLAEGVCGKPQTAIALATLTVLGDTDVAQAYETLGSLGDMDADGGDDLATECHYCERPDGTVGWTYHIVDGPQWGWDVPHSALASKAWTDRGFENDLMPSGPLGDFDGDGFEDALFASDSGDGLDAQIYVLPGPTTDWEDRSYATSLASFWWESSVADGTGTGHYTQAGDWNGDGLADFVVYAGADGSKVDNQNHIRVVFGRAASDHSNEYNLRDEVAIYEEEPTVNTYIGWKMAAGDFDGDGVDDLITLETQYDMVYLVSGPDMESSDGALIEDVAQTTLAGAVYDVTGLGDWNGDGYDDWVAGHYQMSYDGEEVGGLRFIEGTAAAIEGDLDDVAAGVVYGAYDDQQLGSVVNVIDFDGDTVLELMVFARATDDEEAHGFGLLRSADGLPDGTSVYSPDFEFKGMEYGTAAAADWDADGDQEFITYLTGLTEGESPGGFLLVPGWEVPWDSPEYW